MGQDRVHRFDETQTFIVTEFYHVSKIFTTAGMLGSGNELGSDSETAVEFEFEVRTATSSKLRRRVRHPHFENVCQTRGRPCHDSVTTYDLIFSGVDEGPARLPSSEKDRRQV